jgi:CRISPR type III-B/RAMP module RAMP protein Cmr6
VNGGRRDPGRSARPGLPGPGGRRLPGGGAGWTAGEDGEIGYRALRAAVVELLERADVGPGLSPGFYFQRCLGPWREDRRSLDKEKKASAVAPMESVETGGTGVVQGEPGLHRALLRRQEAAFTALRESYPSLERRLRNLAPIVTGIGQPHPLENGFAFLRPYGVPYLAGSGVKGAVRAACRETWLVVGGEAEAGRLLRHHFGSESKEPSGALRRGALLFFDLLPEWNDLEARGWADAFRLDLVNPHYGPYYQHRDVPADWHAPVPSYFLTLRADLEWRLRIVYAALDTPRDTWREEIEPGLRTALTERGLGAKRSGGYGLFEILGDGAGSAAEGSSAAAAAGSAGADTAGPPSPSLRQSPVAASLAQFISTLRLGEVRPQIGRVESDLARCRPKERGPLAEQFEARLRELRMKDRDVRELMGRVRRVLGGGEGGAA